MSNDTDPIGNLESLASEFTERDGALRYALNVLAQRLVTACHGASIFVSGDPCAVEFTSPDEGYSAHFQFNGDRLLIAYLHSEDNYGDPSYGPSYRVKSIDNASSEWLTKLISSGSLATLLRKLTEQMQQQISVLDRTKQTVDNIANDPSLSVATAFEQVAQEIGYDRAVSDWKKAQQSVHSNPEAAITRACSLLETICRHIIDEVGQELPDAQAIQSLFKSACKIINLDPAQQAESELTTICGGLNSVAQGIGALRTKFGDAHGKSAGHTPAAPSQARFAVNAAGTIGTFLMERWSAQRNV